MTKLISIILCLLTIACSSYSTTSKQKATEQILQYEFIKGRGNAHSYKLILFNNGQAVLSTNGYKNLQGAHSATIDNNLFNSIIRITESSEFKKLQTNYLTRARDRNSHKITILNSKTPKEINYHSNKIKPLDQITQLLNQVAQKTNWIKMKFNPIIPDNSPDTKKTI